MHFLVVLRAYRVRHGWSSSVMVPGHRELSAAHGWAEPGMLTAHNGIYI